MINYIINNYNNYDNVCLISILVNVIKIKRDFLYIEHMDKGCHDQGILVDLHRLYTLVTCITAMITSGNCFHTPKNIFFKCQSAKAGVIPSRRSNCVLARVFAH